MTPAEALANATRLLHDVELETDLAKLKAVNDLADSWIAITALLCEHEDARS